MEIRRSLFERPHDQSTAAYRPGGKFRLTGLGCERRLDGTEPPPRRPPRKGLGYFVMPIVITDNGSRNTVAVPADILMHQNGSIIFEGDDNNVVMEEGTVLLGGRIQFGSGCTFVSGRDCRLASIDVYAVKNGRVRIGDRTGFTWHTRLQLHEPGEIVIGADCLIAGTTALSVSDMHSLVDIESGHRINPAKNIVLGDRVWLGEGVKVLKGVSIGDGAAVGASAVVTKDIPGNVVAAGIPARVVRRGVTWRQELL